MSGKWTLDVDAMEEDFFSDCALIGIVSAMPAYKLCWRLNNTLDIDFVREPELDILVQKPKAVQHYFPIYQYAIPLSGCRHLMYKLKSDKEALLPEIKQLDYLWLIQSHKAAHEAHMAAQQLRNIADIQLAQILDIEKLKNLSNLLV
ncbi:MAG: IPExxxVDY family protein [Sphingobacteriales bacterium]|nr:MAG: IPExxxVDY family protein [Sphingobacteriales bacterium]